jgi:hypothetical protein
VTPVIKIVGVVLGLILALLVLMAACMGSFAGGKEKITTAKTPRPEVTLKRYHYLAPAMGSDDNWLYAELNWNGRSDRALILYSSILMPGPISWVRPDKMVMCLHPDTIKEAELHRKVTLSAGGRTVDLYTELKGDCPGEIREGDGPL